MCRKLEEIFVVGWLFLVLRSDSEELECFEWISDEVVIFFVHRYFAFRNDGEYEVTVWSKKLVVLRWIMCLYLLKMNKQFFKVENRHFSC